MRSSNKSRSRNKNNNNNNRRGNAGNTGNIVNRVFDSSGPDGRVRGTPQQIVEKYQSLARDAQLSGDRIGSENFAQHAEHYSRLLGEAQREINQRREAMEAQRKENASQNQPQNQQQGQQQPQQGQQTPQNAQQPKVAPAQPQNAPVVQSQSEAPQPEIESVSGTEIFPGQDNDSNLVQTPENTERKPAKPRQPRKARAPKEGASEQPDVVVEKPAPKRRKPAARKPAKTDALAGEDTVAAAPVEPASAASVPDETASS